MKTILITGATGNVGRPLVSMLSRTGVRVRAVTRQQSFDLFPTGVDTVASALAGLPGADAVFVNSRALDDELAPFVASARRAGVRRLVALSAINPRQRCGNNSASRAFPQALPTHTSRCSPTP